jgi:dihydroceramidase
MYVMEVTLRPSLRAKYGAIESRDDGKPIRRAEFDRMALRDRKILRDMWWLVGVGLSVFLGGFGIWNLDNQYCSTIRRWRHEVGLPYGILLEGHGWWLVIPDI